MHMTEQEQPSHCTQQWVKELLNAAPEPSYLGPFEARLQSLVMHPHIRTDTVGELRKAVNFTPSTASLNLEEPGTSRADTSALGLKWVRQQYPDVCAPV